jgi:hypothetical protein
MCYVGQNNVFEEGEELLRKTMNLEISCRQIQRVSEHYGEQIDKQQIEYNPVVLPQISVKDKQDPVYIMMDGSMLYTREQDWMEVKLGRIFSESQRIDIQENRTAIMNSVYVCHLGESADFLIKLERYILHYKNKVFVADGARWIWKWVEDNYPGSIQILDFFHAIEKLAKFSTHQFTKDEQRKNWLTIQKTRLLENGVDQVIQELITMRPKNAQAKETKQDVIRYYQDHEDRMQYKTYREMGLMIGSGPIESAHRNVIQQRLKLSGQRWSIKGAQHIANLRAMKKSNNWSCILNLIKNAA